MVLLDEFKIYLQIDKSYSENTIRSYLYNLSVFNRYLEKNNIYILDVEYIDISNFLKNLKIDENYSIKSINSYISSLKAFYTFLLKEHYINNNPTSLLKSPKIKERFPVYLTKEELDLIISSINTKTHIGQRDFLLYKLLYDTGVRVSELINIKINDIDIENRIIKILGKGNKERIVLFTESTKKYLLEYINNYVNKINTNIHYLFTKSNGKPINRVEVYNIIRKYAEKVNINKKITPHVIRHTFATHMIQNDADVLTVKTILGHSKLSTTQLYTHLNKKDLKNKYDSIKERK